ncbi:mutS protein homolog 5-like [Pollicipes pollicipes]|uniref:mutS protein homolog 5-like n=1 Tax=Pollicipes pollicipes TaxID=41117 RepID=UPI001884DFC5|nr:mutS protein homolog 5-like [Pollicipes pollicipes]
MGLNVLPGMERSPAGEDADDESAAGAPTLLSLAYGGGHLAAALYDPLSMTLRALLGQVQPDQVSAPADMVAFKVITSGRQDERLLTQLSELVAADARAGDDQSRLQLQPAGDFRADSCRHRVMAVQLPEETSGDEQAHYNFITSRVDFSQTTMIRAFGGLLRFLDRRPLETLSRQPVMRLETLSLEDVMYVSSGAFQTLQVFSADRHPSSFKANATREGLSVFAALNKCCSPLGVAHLRRVLLQPLTNRARIEQRLDAVEFFTRPGSEDVLTSLQSCLRRVRNLTPLLNRLRNARALAGDWGTLYDSLRGCVVVGEICRELPRGVALFERVAAADSGAVQRLVHTLHATVNLTETRELRRFSVQLGLDDALDRHKRTYAELPELLSREMAAQQEQLPDEVQTCSMVFLPQIGFLIMVDEWRVGDVATAIRDGETLVMLRLSALVLAAAEQVHRLTALCGELDAVMALARAAAEFGYVRPQFVDDNVLELVQSRHPLLELCADVVVPNDFFSDGGGLRDRLKLVTGANGGGKSVYLRQVALAVLMAQAGSFVAASSVRLGVQRALLTVTPPALTGATAGSAFLAELRQLCAALAESGERTLLLVDEFGGGTLAEDGAALLAALVTPVCPELVAEPGAEQVTFLYQMTTGAAGKSYALAAARLACLPHTLIERAAELREAHVARCRRAAELFLRADLEADEPRELLRRVRAEYRASLDEATEESAAAAAGADGTRSAEGPAPEAAEAEERVSETPLGTPLMGEQAFLAPVRR